MLCAITAGLSYFAANWLATRSNLYRFGIEEAAAMASVGFAMASAALFAGSVSNFRGDAPVLAALVIGCLASFAIFLRFGYVYAAVASIELAAAVPFVPGDSDLVHRLVSITILAVIFAVVRSLRNRARPRISRRQLRDYRSRGVGRDLPDHQPAAVVMDLASGRADDILLGHLRGNVGAARRSVCGSLFTIVIACCSTSMP